MSCARSHKPIELTRRMALPLASLAILAIAGCHSGPSTPAPTRVAAATAPPTYVGSAVCAPCHSGEFTDWNASRHAHTLQRVTRKELGALAPPTGRVPSTVFTLVANEGGIAASAPAQSDAIAPLKYALGSGKTGMTYVTPAPDGRLLEFHMSYFPHQKAWYVTPGQESLAPDDLGKIHPPADGRKCILCHAVTLPEQSGDPQPAFYGVGCESCHGPGSAHIAAKQGGPDSAGGMDDLTAWPSRRLLDLCGRCHGTKQDVVSQNLPKSISNRMEPYRLSESRCYQESHDTLSCLTCHNPHHDASADDRSYERVCLSCHTKDASKRPSAVRAQEVHTCPVNPRSGCVKCHMPARQAIPNTKLPTWMADHEIRVDH